MPISEKWRLKLLSTNLAAHCGLLGCLACGHGEVDPDKMKNSVVCLGFL
jgi:hypothetical protein